jgi:glycine cleavage system H lipoate-binding protein
MMRARSGLHRTCRHSLTGRIGMRACARDFNCARCDFDQFFEEVCAPRSSAPVGDPRPIRGFALPAAFHLHIGHAWVRREEGGFLRVGLDDFALKLFGRFDRMELPLTGHRLDRGRPGWTVQRQERRAEVLAPLDGVVVDVNARVRERPDVASHDPYGAGWLFTLHAEGGGSLPGELMSGEACRGWMAGEVDRLEEMIEEVAGPLAADGGYLAEEIFGKLPALDWNRLSRTFLRT